MPFVYKCDSCGEITVKPKLLCQKCDHINKPDRIPIETAILLAAQYKELCKGSYNSYIVMENFIDWLQRGSDEYGQAT
jgi:hypothetical protein